MINMQTGGLNHSEPFTETEMARVDKLLGALTKRCQERSEAAEVTSVFKSDGLTGFEYEISIFDGGVLDSTFRVYRDMQSGRIVFVRFYKG